MYFSISDFFFLTVSCKNFVSLSVKLESASLDLKADEEDYAMTSESYIEVGFLAFSQIGMTSWISFVKNHYISTVCLVVQKLSALSSSLARVVSSVEEEEAQLDQFPVEGV